MDISRSRNLKLATAAILAAIAIMAALLVTGAAQASTQAPGQPANPTASVIVPQGQPATVRVGWDNPDDATVTGYTLLRSDGRSFTSDGQATTYTDSEINPGTAYAYTVTCQFPKSLTQGFTRSLTHPGGLLI